MRIIGNALQKSFLIEYQGKEYYVNYLSSDYPDPGLLNRDNWEIIDEDGEELSLYFLKSGKKDKSEIRLITQKYNKLISFCIKNFNFYKPRIK